MGTWLVWVGSFGMRGADEAGCHRGDGSLVFYWYLSLLESGLGLCRFTQWSLVAYLATWYRVWSSGLRFFFCKTGCFTVGSCSKSGPRPLTGLSPISSPRDPSVDF